MADITMPRLSDTMSEGAVGRWLKQPGDKVTRDEVIAEIETDKATMDLVSFEDGTLQQIVVPEGKIVPIGEVIGIIGDGPAAAGAQAPKTSETADATAQNKAGQDKAAQDKATQSSAAQPSEAQRGADKADAAGAAASGKAEAPTGTAAEAGEGADQAPAAAASAPAGAEAGERVRASPLARKIAEEHGLDLRRVQGSGPSGRILKANVEEFRRRGGLTAVPAPAGQPGAPAARQGGAAPAAPAKTGEVVPLSRIRRAVARAMSESKPGTPHIYLTVEIDMAAAMTLRKQINDSGASPASISPNDLLVKAAAKALAKHPLLNASYATTADGQPGVIQHSQINVSVAVATDNGLLAPVIHDADKKGLGAIAAEVKDLAARARTGGLKQHELEGATFQTSNLGMFGVVEFVSIITPPQAASLAIGAVRQVPVVKDGALAIGERLQVTLSVDHRVADGAVAAQYLQELTRLLQAPFSLLI